MLRRLIRHPSTQALLARLLGLYLAMVYRTTRWTLLGEPNLFLALRKPGAPPEAPYRGAIGAFWHERLPMIPMVWTQARRVVPELQARRAHVLVSRHRDGRFIGEIVRRFKLEMVHASTSAGGATGLRVLLRVLAAGDIIAITPDGPRGPRRTAAAGVAQLAAVADLPVLPCAARTSRAWLMNSWDKMVLPLPFARGVLVVGAPVPVDRAAPEASLPAIEAALTAACELADAWVADPKRRAAIAGAAA